MKYKRNGKSSLTIVQKYHPEVTRVVDAKKGVEIEVTQEDCRTGKGKKPSACAMAKAFCRTHDGAIISTTRAYIIDGHTATRYSVPQSVSREIVAFDRAHKFHPGDYNLTAPTKSTKLGAKPGRLSPTGNHTGERARARQHYTTGIRSL